MLNLLIDPGPAGNAPLFRTIELPRDQPPVPSQNRLGPHDARDLREGLAAEPLPDLGQGPAFPVAQFQSAWDLRLSMRFSATRYSFLRRSSSSTEPVTQAWFSNPSLLPDTGFIWNVRQYPRHRLAIQARSGARNCSG